MTWRVIVRRGKVWERAPATTAAMTLARNAQDNVTSKLFQAAGCSTRGRVLGHGSPSLIRARGLRMVSPQVNSTDAWRRLSVHPGTGGPRVTEAGHLWGRVGPPAT